MRTFSRLFVSKDGIIRFRPRTQALRDPRSTSCPQVYGVDGDLRLTDENRGLLHVSLRVGNPIPVAIDAETYRIGGALE